MISLNPKQIGSIRQMDGFQSLIDQLSSVIVEEQSELAASTDTSEGYITKQRERIATMKDLKSALEEVRDAEIVA